MSAPMSDEQLAEIHTVLADWTSYCGHRGPEAIIRDLLAEVERLRNEAAEQRIEWGYTRSDSQIQHAVPDRSRAEAHANFSRGRVWTRLVGEWREAD